MVPTSELSKLNSRASLDRSPGKNWVENTGGLPMYIRRIANHVHAKGMAIGHAIAIAVNAVKKMCATGDINFKGKQNVNAGSRAEACAAVADWERKKAQARVSKGVLGRKWSDEEMIDFLLWEGEIHKSMDCGCGDRRKKKRNKKVSKKSKEFPESDFKKAPKGKKCSRWGCGKPAVKMRKTGQGELGACSEHAKEMTVGKSVHLDDKKFDQIVSEFDAEIDADIRFEARGEIEKRDDEQRLVFGWCSIAKHKDGTVEVDKQGDVLEDIDQMEKVAYDFVLNSRDGGEMHVRKGVSTLVESFMSTPEKWEAMDVPEGVLPIGWWVGFKVHDEEVWKGVKSGKYKMFSVHGSGTRKSIE